MKAIALKSCVHDCFCYVIPHHANAMVTTDSSAWTAWKCFRRYSLVRVNLPPLMNASFVRFHNW